MPRHLLSLLDWMPDDLGRLLDLAGRVKADPTRYAGALANRNLGLLFLKSSTRTRVSFEVGIRQLGGSAVFLSGDDLQLSRGETIADTARVLSTYLDVLMVRLFAHNDLEELARHSSVPVINGLSDDFHPCQALADYLTLVEEWGDLEGRRLAYIGDGNNMARSLVLGAAKLGVEIALACPAGFRLEPEFLDQCRQIAASADAITEHDLPADAVAGAGAVYADTWISMGQEAERDQRLAAFSGFQVDEDLMARAGTDAVFLHCLPCHRGEEVAAEVVDGPRSRVWRQVENRLHAQKAVLLELLLS